MVLEAMFGLSRPFKSKQSNILKTILFTIQSVHPVYFQGRDWGVKAGWDRQSEVVQSAVLVPRSRLRHAAEGAGSQQGAT